MKAQIVNVSLKLIRQAAEDRSMKPLAAYHMLKARFINGRVYEYQSRMNQLAAMLGVCTKTLYNYLDLLRGTGLIYQSGNTLMLKSLTQVKYELSDKRKYTITIQVGETIHDVTARLYAKLIERHARSIAQSESLTRFLEKGNNEESRNFHNGVESETGALFNISLRNLQRLLNIDKATAAKLVGKLNKHGIIKTYPPAKLIQKCNDPQVLAVLAMEGMPFYYYLIGRNICMMTGSRHQLVEHPVIIPKMTAKKYKALKKRMISNEL